jgi:hypothetical protein
MGWQAPRLPPGVPAHAIMLYAPQPGRAATDHHDSIPIDTFFLNDRITACTTGEGLIALVQLHGHSFEHYQPLRCFTLPNCSQGGRACSPRSSGISMEVARQHVQQMEPQHLTNTAWAMATLGHKDAAFMGALVQAATPRLPFFSAQSLANMAWALAKFGHVDAVFMGSLVQEATSKLPHFKPQELANTARASYDGACGLCVGALLEVAMPQLPRFTPQAWPTRRGRLPPWATSTQRTWSLCEWRPNRSFPSSLHMTLPTRRGRSPP